jgi:hypothetical protein
MKCNVGAVTITVLTLYYQVCTYIQDCQMVCFQTKIPNLGKFWRVLQWKMLVYVFYGHLVHVMVFWYILFTFGVFCGNLVYFSPFW